MDLKQIKGVPISKIKLEKQDIIIEEAKNESYENQENQNSINDSLEKGENSGNNSKVAKEPFKLHNFGLGSNYFG